MSAVQPSISVVIPTHERCEGCKRAVQSALDQEYPALEVLVCDDASTDGTQDALESWAREEPRLRYLRLPSNHGGPAVPRNLGTKAARGDWVAFLYDDDRWLPGKLQVQGEALASGRYDLVASDARRSGGSPYFGHRQALEPDRAEFLRHNPIITSTAVVRRLSLLAAGGFPSSTAWISLSGVEDYAAWLQLAYRGARVLILPDQLVAYDDIDENRISRAAARQEAAVAAIRWRLWLRRLNDPAVFGSALRGTSDAARTRLRQLRS